MSALPKEIHIKRKRGAEEVPGFLQVDDFDAHHGEASAAALPGLQASAKRRMSSKFLYQRRVPGSAAVPQDGPVSNTSIDTLTRAAPEAPPTIKTSQPGDERRATPSKIPTATNHNGAMTAATQGREIATPVSAMKKSTNSSGSGQPRSFHLSRSAMSLAGHKHSRSTSTATGVSKRSRYGPAIFIERTSKRASSKTRDSILAGQLESGEIPSYATDRFQDVEMTEPARTYKKPGAKRIAKSSEPANNESQQRKPMPMINPTDDTNKIAKEMDDWVLSEIGQNIKDMEKKPSSPKKAAGGSRLKPKAPAKRFAERNPELQKKLDAGGGPGATKDDVMAEAEASDDDYEIVVYELAPRNEEGHPNLAVGDIAPEDIGVLKFDSREDMELFYGDEGDDSDWMPDDEEDENAENHYTAEYPEELDSDDSEFDGGGNGDKFAQYVSEDEDDIYSRLGGGGGRNHYLAYDEFDGSDNDDEWDDRYVMEGDDESRDNEALQQEHIRRYIRRFGAG